MINLDHFPPEHKKNIIEIFGDLMALQLSPNPLAQGLSANAEETIEKIFDKFEASGMSTHYANILKMMASKYELVNYFLKIEVFQVLSKYVNNAVFDISSEALSVYQEILFSEDKKVQGEVSTFNNNSYVCTVYMPTRLLLLRVLNF